MTFKLVDVLVGTDASSLTMGKVDDLDETAAGMVIDGMIGIEMTDVAIASEIAAEEVEDRMEVVEVEVVEVEAFR